MTDQSRVQSRSADAPVRRPRKWSFPAAMLSVLVLVGSGQLGMIAISDHWRVFADLRETMSLGAALLALPGATIEATYAVGTNIVRDIAFSAFVVSFAVFAWLRRDEFATFFRSMTVGVSLIFLSTAAVAVGVVVPQIDPPDDAGVRVDSPNVPGSNYESHYESFQWAVSYFLYHLDHLYGVGMPEADIPEVAAAGLDEFGRRYGFEERDNQRKGMAAAFTGAMKSNEIFDFAQRHDADLRAAFDFATRFHLNRIYRSYWFASLLIVLAIAIATNTFHGGPKRWFTRGKFGFFLVHVGMLTMLAGGGISRVFTERGILHLHRDGLDRNGDGVYQRERGEIPPIEDAFFKSYQAGLENLRFMPFGLSLEHFARRDWPAVQVFFLDGEGVPIEFKSRLPTYTLWNGRTIDLDFVENEDGKLEPRVRLIARRLYDRARADGVTARERSPEERKDQPRRPAVRLEVPDFRALMQQAVPGNSDDWARRSEFMPASMPNQDALSCLSDPMGRFRLTTIHGGDPAQRFPAVEGRLGRCYVRAVVDGEQVVEVVDVRLGQFIPLPGGYRVVFQRATKDYQVDPQTGAEIVVPRPLAEQYPIRPAVFAHIIDPSGASEDRILEDGVDPLMRGMTAGYTFEDLVLSLEWDDWTAPGPPRFVLHYDTDVGPTLHAQSGGEPVPLRLGQPLPLGGGIKVVLEEVFDDLISEPTIVTLDATKRSDGWHEDFYSRDARGLELDVVMWPERASERRTSSVRLATSRDRNADVFVADDRSFVLQFIENKSGFPFEWRSVLKVHERDANGEWAEVDLGPERRREIRVNDYFKYAGYRMFQTNAVDGDPDYSGIGIVYDPGIPMAIAGMWIVIAGAAFAFLVRPVLIARDKAAVSATSSRPSEGRS